MKKLYLAALAACAVAQPAFAQDVEANHARDGLRIEARAMYETPTVSSLVDEDDIFKLGSAFAFGGEIGYDIAVSDKLVVGPYVNYEFSTVEACDEFGDCVSAKDNFAGGLHLGYALGDGGQFFGKLGYARLALEADIDNVQISDSGEGFQFAFGYEHGFGKNLYGRAEFGYADNGDIFGLNFQRRHAGVALGARF